MNLGHHALCDFDFKCGAKLRAGRPVEIDQLLPLLATLDCHSPSELRQMQIAGGWLWLGSDEHVRVFPETPNFATVCFELAETLRQLLLWIDLAGGGENSYWRYGNNCHCAGAYIFSSDLMMPLQFRTRYLYSTPLPQFREAPWSLNCLELADRLHQIASAPDTRPLPRVSLALNLRQTMMSWDARRMRTRFSLCCTALETLFIGPSEGRNFYDPPIKRRVRQASASVSTFGADFFDLYRARRNDAVHRAGQSTSGELPKEVLTEIQSEVVLRESLLWAIANRDRLADAFESDTWPPCEDSSA